MSKPRIVVVEHQDSCPPALFGEWMTAAGAEVEICRPYRGEEIPDAAAADGWLVLGGSPPATADDVMPWLPRVRQVLADAGRDGVPALGICLGHQLAAVAYGGVSVPNPAGQQVGLFEIGWSDAVRDDPMLGAISRLRRPDGGPVRSLQWNSDITTVPEGGELLAATPAGEVQAVRFAPTVWGVQFHPEVDEEILVSWAEGDREDHLEKNIDSAKVLAEVAEARAELAVAWQPLAERLVQLAMSARR